MIEEDVAEDVVASRAEGLVDEAALEAALVLQGAGEAIKSASCHLNSFSFSHVPLLARLQRLEILAL